MAVVVEPVLTEEKLKSLLAEGHEQSSLDYKTELDLAQRRDIVELAKDVAAMQAEKSGGYLVIGADDHGVAVSTLSSPKAALFDEAALRSKLKKYLAEPFDVRTARHTIDGCNLVVVYVAPNPEGWCIFISNGEYEVESPPGSGTMKKVIVFRVGDVFVRRGTASQRWDDADRKRLVEQIMARRKNAWRTELREELAATVNVGLNAQQLEQMPASAVTWQLDAGGFDELVTELMRRNDDIPLRRLLMHAQSDASGLLTSSMEDLSTFLDRITSVGALALSYERQDWFRRTVDALLKVYELGVDVHGTRRNDVDSARLWLYVIGRVYALGGLAVRMENWQAVRDLANRQPRGRDFEYWASWLRHALTMAARAEILDEERNSGLIARAHNVVRAVDALHPDVDANADEVLNSLCQFDALGGLVVIGERRRLDTYYPNFARYYTPRTEPAFALVIRDTTARRVLFDGDDDLLAAAIRHMNSTAGREGFNYSGWEGIENPVVRQFLEDHPEPKMGGSELRRTTGSSE